MQAYKNFNNNEADYYEEDEDATENDLNDVVELDEHEVELVNYR